MSGVIFLCLPFTRTDLFIISILPFAIEYEAQRIKTYRDQIIIDLIADEFSSH